MQQNLQGCSFGTPKMNRCQCCHVHSACLQADRAAAAAPKRAFSSGGAPKKQRASALLCTLPLSRAKPRPRQFATHTPANSLHALRNTRSATQHRLLEMLTTLDACQHVAGGCTTFLPPSSSSVRPRAAAATPSGSAARSRCGCRVGCRKDVT